MKQSELYWSRWQNEESLRIYQNHIKRIQEVRPCPELQIRKESRNRTRYVKHRQAAEAIKRQSEQQRIKKGNKLLEERIAKVNLGSDLHKTIRNKQSATGKNHPTRRRQDPIKAQELMVSNISLLRRIVAAKPFASRKEWAHDRKEMKRLLKRLQRSREERRTILVQRDELALQAKKHPDSAKGDCQSPKHALVVAKKRRPVRPKTQKPAKGDRDNLAFARRLLYEKASGTVQSDLERKVDEQAEEEEEKEEAARSEKKSIELRKAEKPRKGAESAHIKSEIERLEQEFAKLFSKKPAHQRSAKSLKSKKSSVAQRAVRVKQPVDVESAGFFLTQPKSPELPPAILCAKNSGQVSTTQKGSKEEEEEEEEEVTASEQTKCDIELKGFLKGQTCARRLSVDIVADVTGKAVEKALQKSAPN